MTWHGWYWLAQSPLPRWFGHASMAIWPFVLDADGTIPPDTLRHEVQHLRQQVAVACVWAALVLVLPVSRWWLLAAHPVPYWLLYLASLRHGYARSWFERDAERKR